MQIRLWNFLRVAVQLNAGVMERIRKSWGKVKRELGGLLLGKFVSSNFYVRPDLNLRYFSLQTGYQRFNNAQLVGVEYDYG